MMTAVMKLKLALLAVLGLIFIGCGDDDAKPADDGTPACGCGDGGDACGDACGCGDKPADTATDTGGSSTETAQMCVCAMCDKEKPMVDGKAPM